MIGVDVHRAARSPGGRRVVQGRLGVVQVEAGVGAAVRDVRLEAVDGAQRLEVLRVDRQVDEEARRPGRGRCRRRRWRCRGRTAARSRRCWGAPR